MDERQDGMRMRMHVCIHAHLRLEAPVAIGELRRPLLRGPLQRPVTSAAVAREDEKVVRDLP